MAKNSGRTGLGKIKTAVSGMNEEFEEMLTTAETEGREPREMREGRQGVVRRACEIHKFRGFDDREERIGDGRSESMGEVTCEL